MVELSTLWIPLIAIGVVVYGLTEGLKSLIPRLAGTWRGVLVRAIPAMLGMALGSIPGVFPDVVLLGMSLLLGGAAGVTCAFSYELVTTYLRKKAEGK